MEPEALFQWFAREARRLSETEPEEAVEEIEYEVQEVDSRLSLEWSADNDEGIELIITAHGNRSAFASAKVVAQGLKAEGWLVCALKPARGFEFKLDYEGIALDAARLKFEPMPGENSPLGLRIFVEDKLVSREHIKEALALVLESGIGEEARAEIKPLQAAALSKAPADARPMAELGAFVESKLKASS